MAGGGDHPGANKRNREVAGLPKRSKRKKPYEDPAVRGSGGAKGKQSPSPPRTIGSQPRLYWQELTEELKEHIFDKKVVHRHGKLHQQKALHNQYVLSFPL
ncbi:hypothetical protein VPH35_049662 [Triticum aestivum]|uniref:Uncharacterized protein n=1 Tax=Triticum aestivum TaxID=4565 RepID=A0A077RPW3_WHEAT|nr:unnamed protein product [Triticum aestivum]